MNRILKNSIQALTLSAGLVFLFFACSPGSGEPEIKTTPSGYKYIMHVDKEGPTAQPGDLVVYTEKILRRDSSVWRTSEGMGRPNQLVIPKLDEVEQSMEMAWFEALSLMSEGDSLTLFQSLDTISSLPMGLEQGDSLTYHFKLISISNEEERMAEIREVLANEDLPRTPSGYVYVMHRDEEGDEVEIGDEVVYHEISYRSGALWYSTYDLNKPREVVIPNSDNLPDPVPPTYEALFFMSPGDSLTVYQPLSDYENLPSSLSKDDVLTFSVKLVSVANEEELEARAKAAQERYTQVESRAQAALKKFLSGELEGVKTLESGLKYVVLKEGEGPEVIPGQKVEVHYAGYLQANGAMFDNSFSRGKPIPFVVSARQMIPGFDEGVEKLRQGSEAVLFIPSELGYGAQKRPKIPANSDLAFFVEVVSIE